MTKPTVTIERCQQIGHQLNLQVALTCPVPPVYPKLSVVFTCGERTRIIPMAFTDSDGSTLRAQKTVELAYVFYEPPVGQPWASLFFIPTASTAISRWNRTNRCLLYTSPSPRDA